MIQVKVFGADGVRQAEPAELKTLLTAEDTLIWADIHGPDLNDIQTMLEVFHFHPLAVEDTRNHEQRPKIEEYPGYLFLIVNPVSIIGMAAGEKHDLDFRELDLFVGHNYIVTVHLDNEPSIAGVERRLATATNLTMSISYLLYLILDVVVDGYFPIMDMLEDEIGGLEDSILMRPSQQSLNRLFELKHLLLQMWRAVWPERDLLSMLAHPHHQLFNGDNSVQLYLRDVADHLLWIADMINTYRDTLTTVIDLYMSAVSNRLNKVVNRLTVLTLLIGVMTVVSGFYGMNFENTWPPFSSPWGVPFVLFLMTLGMGGILFYVWQTNRD